MPQELAFDSRSTSAEAAPVALVRGHPFPGKGGKVIRDFNPDIVLTRAAREYSAPIVRVSGNQQRGQLMLILDVSGSMLKERRWEQAKAALNDILQSLVTTGSYDFGLRFYGHRDGFDPAPPHPRRWNTKLGPRLAYVTPGTDIEKFLPINPFGRAEYAQITERLKLLEPWGATPYYLAIINAVEQDFDFTAPVSSRRVVVITDGLNDQEDNGITPATAKRRETDVINVLRRHDALHPGQPIHVDVVRFRVREADPLQEAAQGLRSRVTFHSADDREALLRRLREAVGLYTYQVEVDGRRLPPQELGVATTIDLGPAGAVCRVLIDNAASSNSAFASEPFLLERGQRVDFALKSNGLTLVAKEPEGLTHAVVSDPEAPETRYRITAHRTRREIGRDVTFPISLQDESRRRVTRMPVESWVEIRPRGQTAPVYRFYDPEFEDKQPQPMLLCRVPWPRDQLQAEITLFARFQLPETQPQKTIRVRDAAVQGVEMPGLKFSVHKQPEGDGFRVIVRAEHAAEGELHRLKVEMHPPAARLTEQIDSQLREVRYLFDYPRVTETQVDQYEIRIITRDQLEKRAVKLGEPLIVGVE
jgi:hypothetical protein